MPSFETVDDSAKPMSQDSYSAGFDFEVIPRTVATFHFVHNNLNRTIEDLGALVDGNEAYLLGNPGEGTTRDHAGFGGASHRRRFLPHAESQAAIRRRRAWHQPPVREQLVRQRQPDDQPPVWQLRRSGELGRNPDADHRRQLGHRAAAGRLDLP